MQETRVIRHLTEEAVKRATMPFLRAYYKFRPNLMENQVTAAIPKEQYTDVHTPDGVVSDGMLIYEQREEEEQFIVSFEATAYNTRDELHYRIQHRLLLWDGMALGSILSLILLAMAFVEKWIDIDFLGVSLVVGCLLLICLAAAGVYWLILGVFITGVDRYHYIYAVEQFKHYFANEQWIAFGTSVFKHSDDPHLEELKDQCMKNGFGLVEIDEDLKGQLIMTPARVGLLSARKEIKELVKKQRYTNLVLNNRFMISIREKLRKSKQQARKIGVLRFQRSYNWQLLICGVSSLLISAIIWKDISQKEELYTPREQHLIGLKAIDFHLHPKPERDPKDSLDQFNIQPYRETDESYSDSTDSNYPLHTTRKRIAGRHPSISEAKADSLLPDLHIDSAYLDIDVAITPENNLQMGLFLSSKGEITAEYPCQRIAQEGGIKYALQHAVFPTKASAIDYTTILSKRGIAANALWLNCFNEKNDSFLVFVDLLYDSLQIADVQLQLSKLQFSRMELDSTQLRLRRLYKKAETPPTSVR